MSAIGFVIVSYSNPEQLLRLTERVSSMFQDAKISCAHDFGQTSLDQWHFPPLVSFVRPHVDTHWGDITVVHAAMRALRELYEKHDPDWFVLLSGSDYPVVNADTILRDLETGGYDAYLDFRAVTDSSGRVVSSLDKWEAEHRFGHPGWAQLAYERYVAKPVALWPTRRTLFIWHRWLVWPFHPFTSELRCFGGDHWFTANRRVGRVLLDEYEKGERLIKHFTKRAVPEEAFYQTVICNQPRLRLNRDNKRYTNWSSGGAHPKFLEADDLPAIAASGAHFARKFRPGAPVLNALDRVIDNK